jgi:hypothetical protein
MSEANKVVLVDLEEKNWGMHKAMDPARILASDEGLDALRRAIFEAAEAPIHLTVLRPSLGVECVSNGVPKRRGARKEGTGGSRPRSPRVGRDSAPPFP